jgi:type IV pilus assembly protein PilE
LFKRKFCRGLTLLELITAMAIIGVLAMIAYPTYKHNLRFDKSALAKTYLLEVANSQHSYLRRYGAYASNLEQLGSAPSKPLSSYYHVYIEVDQDVAVANFTLKAVPLLSVQEVSLPVFTLNHVGLTSDNWYD